GFSEPRQVPNIDLRYMLDLNGNTIRLRQYDIFDVVDLVTLRQVLSASAVQEANPTDVHGLLTEINSTSPHIRIGIADRADHLRQGDVVGVELVQVDFDLEFFGGAAPRIHLHDAFDSQEAALHDPVLHGTKIGQAEARCSD